MKNLQCLVTLICAEQQAKSLLRLWPACVHSGRAISTTATLQAKKQQRRWRPKVPAYYTYGAAHRLVRGLCVRGERYGPLVDKPDYTFLDGRPTPLTPAQLEERDKRIQMAATAVKYMEEMDTVKKFNATSTPKVLKHDIPQRIKGRPGGNTR